MKLALAPILVLAAALAAFGTVQPVHVPPTFESEPNDALLDADSLPLASLGYGRIHSEADADTWMVVVPRTAAYRISAAMSSLTAPLTAGEIVEDPAFDLVLEVYDGRGRVSSVYGISVGAIVLLDVPLRAGPVFLRVRSSGGVGGYSVRVDP